MLALFASSRLIVNLFLQEDAKARRRFYHHRGHGVHRDSAEYAAYQLEEREKEIIALIKNMEYIIKTHRIPMLEKAQQAVKNALSALDRCKGQ